MFEELSGIRIFNYKCLKGWIILENVISVYLKYVYLINKKKVIMNRRNIYI